MKKLTRIAPMFVVGTLALAACGGSDGAAELSGEDEELAEELAAIWAEDESFPTTLSTECLANGFISGIGGAEGAEGYGVNVDNIGEGSFDENPLNEEDALAAVGEMYKCDGFKTALAADFAGTDDTDAAECLAGEISDEPLTNLLASSFMGDAGIELEEQYGDAFEMEFFAGMETCEISG